MKLHEVYLLLEKYRKEFVDKLIIKYRNEIGESFNENEALENIDFFDKYNEKLPKEKRNLQEYTYKDLVDAVNSIKSNTKLKEKVEVDFLSTKLIYQNNSLQIYSGDSEKACVAIRGDTKTEWCIATPQNNKYYKHRYSEKEPSFYFIKNTDRLNKIQDLEEDPYSFFIIVKNKDNEFIVTDALNDGENPMTWEEILKLEPLLNGKEELFKHIPLNDDEKEYYRRFKNGIPDNEYKDLSYKEKKIYIAITHELNDEKFKNTPNDLINDYISMSVGLSQDQLDFIKDKRQLFNNYRRVTIDNFIPEYIKGYISFGSRWLVLTNDEVIDLYNKKSENLWEILYYKPQLVDYFKDKLDKDKLYELSGYRISLILSKQPQLIGKFENLLDRLDTDQISEIISNQPQLIRKFEDKLIDLENNGISLILSKQPQLINKFEDKLNRLSGDGIVNILIYQPQLINKFEDILDELDYKDKNFILIYQPQLKPYFDKIKRINENKKMKLYNILLEQIELFEISQKIKDEIFKKFKIEEPNVSDENIKYYIDEFEKRKGNPAITKKDIQTYTFKELEKVIDSLPTNQKISKSDNNVEFSNTELIYNQSPLQIYHGENEKTCIKIKGDFPSSWCVSRSSGGNMYNTYRYAGTDPSFYFVKNLDRLNKITEIEDDLFCFFVIQFNNQGEYIVTNAKNDGDKEMSWQEILKLEPLLNGKEGLFKNVPLTDEEKEYYARFKDGISDKEYIDLPYKEKKIYFSITHELNDVKFKNTPNDLINDYITTGVELTREQFDFIKDKQSLLNNYRRVTIDNVIPQYIKGTIRNFGNRWLVLTDDEAIDIYNKKEVNFPEILQYKPKLIGKFENVLYKLNNNNITGILEKQPQLIGNFEDKLSGLTTNNISSIISNQPQLFEKFKLDELDGFDISNILQKQPQLIEKFENDLNKLNKFNIKDILTKQPQLKPYFDNIKPINENRKLKLLNLI